MRHAAILIAVIAASGCQSEARDESSPAAAKPQPRFANAPVRGCDESVSGDLGRNWRSATTLVGPLGLVGSRGYANENAMSFRAVRKGVYRGQKVLLLVRRGSTVTLVVPREARRVASLLYDPAAWRTRNAYRVSDGDVAMRFRACEGVYGVRPHEYTQFNGSFVVAGPRCVPLDVYAVGRDDPLRAVLSFGAGRCR